MPARVSRRASTWSILSCACLITAGSIAQAAEIGRPATPDEIAAWDIDIRPDGTGLPEGQGDVWTGEEIFTDLCASCHGDFGEGLARYPALAGSQGTLTRERPVKTIGSYWPYLSTVFDYVRRAQPFGAPGTLTDDEIYAVTAYLLYLNDLVGDDFILSRDSFKDVSLPNEAGYIGDTREGEPSAPPCMVACGPQRQVLRRASDLDIE